MKRSLILALVLSTAIPAALHAQTAAVPKPSPSPGLPVLVLPVPSPSASPGMAPDVALRELKDGNDRFLEGSLKQLPLKATAARRAEVVMAEKPIAVVLSCSDSRVPPELIFDRGLGELITLRVGANLLGSDTVASIENAIEKLPVRLIVVMGHEGCTTIRQALHLPPGESAGSPDLDSVMSTVQVNLDWGGRSLASEEADETPDDAESFDINERTLRRPVMKNVDRVVDRLTKRSKIVRQAIEGGKVAVVRAVYSLDTGKVDFWVPTPVKAPAPTPSGSPVPSPSPESSPEAK